jgi:hypothetical protein
MNDNGNKYALAALKERRARIAGEIDLMGLIVLVVWDSETTIPELGQHNRNTGIDLNRNWLTPTGRVVTNISC